MFDFDYNVYRTEIMRFKPVYISDIWFSERTHLKHAH